MLLVAVLLHEVSTILDIGINDAATSRALNFPAYFLR
jgi:hypothetical protein